MSKDNQYFLAFKNFNTKLDPRLQSNKNYKGNKSNKQLPTLYTDYQIIEGRELEVGKQLKQLPNDGSSK